jgi:3-methyladenine DNA glycosylase AlkD
MITSKEILKQLESLGQDSIKKTFLRHGIKEPVYGVKVEELKKIQKKIKQSHVLALELYASGVYDAMYLAGLIAEPEKMSKQELQVWVKQANAPYLNEHAVASVAAEATFGMQIALEWIESLEEGVASSGWATLSRLISVKEDSQLDIPQLRELLEGVSSVIHQSPNRVKQTMNGFVIALGTYVKELSELAKEAALKIGKVNVDMGDTACKVPDAFEYISKAESKNIIGKKRKSVRC